MISSKSFNKVSVLAHTHTLFLTGIIHSVTHTLSLLSLAHTHTLTHAHTHTHIHTTGDAFLSIDFDQLQIENSQYNQKINERTDELMALKVAAGTTVQHLNTNKVVI